MISPQLIIAAVVALALAGSHWYAYHAGGVHMHDKIIADQVETETLIHDTATSVRQEIGKEVAGQIAGIRVVNRTINNEVQREVHEKPVYLSPDCATPTAGVVLLNAARRGEPGGTGPGADAGVPVGAAARREPAAPPR